MKRCQLFFVSCLILMGLSNAVMASTPLVTDSRIRTLVYSPNEVFKLTTEFGYQSSIEFNQGEQIKTISLGEVSGFKITPSENRLFIRALQQDRHTNMTVITTERVYQLEITSYVEEAEDVIYVLRFYYPEEDFDIVKNQPLGAKAQPSARVYRPVASAYNQSLSPISMAPKFAIPNAPPPSVKPNFPSSIRQAQGQALAPQIIRQRLDGAFPALVPQAGQLKTDDLSQKSASLSDSIQNRNYDYTMDGEETLFPWQVFDDGQKTYIMLPKDLGQDFEIHSLNSDSTTKKLSYDEQGGYIILDNVHSLIKIGSDDKKVILYNEKSMKVS